MIDYADQVRNAGLMGTMADLYGQNKGFDMNNFELYVHAGHTHEGTRLELVAADYESIVKKMFELSIEGRSFSLIDNRQETVKYGLTWRNRDEERKYIASIVAELTASFKFTV